MATMRDIRHRIRSVRNIQKITSAMQMVASARLRQAQNRVVAARPYAEKMVEVMGNLAQASAGIAHPLLEVREPRRMAVVAITAGRGMCGSYNVNVVRRVAELIQEHAQLDPLVLPVGQKGPAPLKHRGFTLGKYFPFPTGSLTLEFAQQITAEVRRLFEQGEVDLVYLVYTRFYSALNLKPTVLQLLPLEPPKREKEENVMTRMEYLFEPEPGELLASLLPRYLDVQVFQALVESVASESAARMTSMRSASDNAKKMIDLLTLSFNRARQSAITTEITEIVGGAEALKG
ncbi:MAG TPA: ATP synthase F1 subunit gamma [Armatimonadota bacterium]|nr:ATP synthase F1 subunit gamma [Armatimonadota bacterium]